MTRKKDADRDVRSYEIVGHLDAHTAEALRLEIRRLAGRYGVKVRKLSVEEFDAWWTGMKRTSPSGSRRSGSRC